MRIDKILYQKIFPTGMAYLNHKIGVEVQVDENDDWEEAFNLAKEFVEQMNVKSNPSMGLAMEYNNGGSLTGHVLPETNKLREKIEIQIENCTSIEELNKLMNTVFQNGLVNEFITKKKELQNV